MSEEIPKPSVKARLVRVLAVSLVVVLLAGGFGFIGHASGTGWFGYRSWMYGTGQLYALNYSAEPLWISIDGREKLEVPAQNANLADLVGGTSVVRVFDGNDKLLDTYDVTIDGSHAFLKLTDDACIAVVDITPFYGGKQQGLLDFEAFLKPDVRLWIAGSRNVVWPRKDFPPSLKGGRGKGLWFEIVGCELFDEPQFLDAYLATRIERRMAEALGKDKAQK